MLDTALYPVLISTLYSAYTDISYKAEAKDQDVWQTPKEAILNGGDCEDKVLYMYITLLLKGVPDSDMEFLAGTIKEGMFKGTAHMVLRVNKEYILDPIEDDVVKEYKSYTKNRLDVYYTVSSEGVFIKGNLVWAREEDPRWQKFTAKLNSYGD